jgi:peptidoglycan hydrolase-like protein with peptidoglycan-binding domain
LIATAALAQDTSTQTAPTSTAAAKSETPKRGPVFRPNKDQITQVQKILIEKKLYAGDATGKFNDETRAGIRSFQKDNGLKETGTLNRATLEKFGVELTEAQKAIPASPMSYATAENKPAKALKSGDKSGSKLETTSSASENTPKRKIFRASSEQVKAAQKLLKSQSMYSGDETGKLDDATRDGLRKYQDSNGLKVTGTLNQVTLEKMGIELTERQKAATAADDKQK